MKVTIDDKSGFCFGVVQAIERAEESIKGGRRVYSLGDIVHNRVEVQRLGELGLATVSQAEFAELRGQRVLIRAHGEPPATYETARRNDIEIIDATCPVVAKLQQRVKEAYAQMQSLGGRVVILGKRGHAEVVGLIGQIDGDATVVEGVDDLDAIDYSRPVYLLSQTTQSLSLFDRVAEEIRNRASDAAQVVVKDTICRQVANREPHLREFARGFDVVVFVSGRKSSNGKVLFEVCLGENPRTHLVEDALELSPDWFEGASSVGVCGATSTPKWLMTQVAEAIEKI